MLSDWSMVGVAGPAAYARPQLKKIPKDVRNMPFIIKCGDRMRTIPSWDQYYLDICKTVASRSKDPNTQIGCVIIGPNREIRSTGYNSFPRGIRVDFGLTQQTDGEVGGPITILAEVVADVLGGVDERGKVSVARNGARILDQLRYQIVGRPGDHCDENAGEE